MSKFVQYLPYPIYSIASNGNWVLTSGGGGGKAYGIEDLLEVHKVKASSQLSKIYTTSSQDGIFDSLKYSETLKSWYGSIKSSVIFFRIDENVGPIIDLKIPIKTSPDTRKMLVHLSEKGDTLVTGEDSGQFCAMKINFKGDSQTNTSDKSPLLKIDTKNPISAPATFSQDKAEVKDFAISKDSKLLAICSSDFSINLWNLTDKKFIKSQKLQGPEFKNLTGSLSLRCCRFLNTSNPNQYELLAIGTINRGPSYALNWQINLSQDSYNFSLKYMKKIGKQPCCCLDISPDQKHFAIGFSDGECKIFNHNIKILSSHHLNSWTVTGICFINNGESIVSCSADYSLCTFYWKQKPPSLIKSMLHTLFMLIILTFFYFLMEDLEYIGRKQAFIERINSLKSQFPYQEFKASKISKFSATFIEPESIGVDQELDLREQNIPPSIQGLNKASNINNIQNTLNEISFNSSGSEIKASDSESSSQSSTTGYQNKTENPSEKNSKQASQVPPPKKILEELNLTQSNKTDLYKTDSEYDFTYFEDKNKNKSNDKPILSPHNNSEISQINNAGESLEPIELEETGKSEQELFNEYITKFSLEDEASSENNNIQFEKNLTETKEKEITKPEEIKDTTIKDNMTKESHEDPLININTNSTKLNKVKDPQENDEL